MEKQTTLLILLVCLLFSIQCFTSNAREAEVERRQREQLQQSCRFDRLNAQEPTQRITSEGGSVELLNVEDSEQFQCAGVAPLRETLNPNALSLPRYTNTPTMAYVVEGEGRLGVVFPGCPETFQSSTSRGGEGQQSQERSQKIRRVRRGDVVAIPAGVAYWLYNDGNRRLQIVAIADTSNHQNQLDQTYRPFYLAGSAPSGAQKAAGATSIGDNILQGFDTDTLAEAMGISQDTARRIQQNQKKGLIVKVERGLRMPGPPSDDYEREREREGNNVEELYCSMRLRHNADDSEDADVYVRNGGRLNTVNRLKLPALRSLRLGAERGILQPNAMFAPSWLNAHAVMYVTRGQGRIQIVQNEGRRVFDGAVKEGQFLVIPQLHAIAKQAGKDGLEWISFTTSDSPIRSTLTGRNSVLKAMPQEVVMNAYRINEKDARDLRRNREHETIILSPTPQHQQPRAIE